MEQTKRQRHNSIDDNDNNRKKKFTIDLDSSSKKSISDFEDLSNEIIYEVFEFLDFCHIYEAFFDLNRRFTNLLTHSSVPIFINFSTISKMTFQRYYTNIIVPYQHRIKSLHLSNPFMINHVFSPIDTPFTFTCLEKLSLTDTDSEFLKDLLIHLASFSCLASLVIKCIDGGRETNNIYHEIFRLPMLKYCKLSCEQNVSHEPLPFATNQFSPIEYLVINHIVYSNDISALLSYVPQLRHLSFHYLKNDYNRRTIMHPITLNHLSHVSLNYEYHDFDKLKLMIINLFNHVQVLYISTKIQRDTACLDASQWERLILSYMPYLRIFDMAVVCHLPCIIDIAEHISLIDRFNSLFWVERQWFFELQIRKRMHDNYIFFYSTNPYRRKCFTLYGEKEGNIDRNDGKSNMDSVHYVDIRNEKAMITCTNYFLNATGFTISIESLGGNGHFLSTNLNSIIPLRQLTNLSVSALFGSFSDIIELLSYTPNVHTLDIKFAAHSTDFFLLLLQKNASFRLVAKTNNIRKMNVLCNNILEAIKFLVTLCPRLQHLTIKRPENNLYPILHYLLSKDNTNAHHLYSLCITKMPENEVRKLQTFIESKNLLNDCTIYVKRDMIYKSMHLWW